MTEAQKPGTPAVFSGGLPRSSSILARTSASLCGPPTWPPGAREPGCLGNSPGLCKCGSRSHPVGFRVNLRNGTASLLLRSAGWSRSQRRPRGGGRRLRGGGHRPRGGGRRPWGGGRRQGLDPGRGGSLEAARELAAMAKSRAAVVPTCRRLGVRVRAYILNIYLNLYKFNIQTYLSSIYIWT